jgi:hypothetical protein
MHDTARDNPGTRETRPAVSDLDEDLEPVNHREQLDCIDMRIDMSRSDVCITNTSAYIYLCLRRGMNHRSIASALI